MKILTNKKYQNLINERDAYKEVWEQTKKELEEAKNLKDLLLKVTDKTQNLYNVCGGGFPTFADIEVSLSDNIPKYVEDILGGKKVIKQEGTLAIVISSTGEVKTGLTKQKPDKGYSYKLIRE